MCGIAAAIGVEKARIRVQSMIALMEGRGDTTDPAGTPYSNVSLGTRRLRILDRENAIQPFWSFDSRFLVVLNGEIFNYKSLQPLIEAKGVSIKTDSDTEVLAHGLALFGTNFIKQFNGMFAFVAYDCKKKEYIAGRDQLGIKPLYYVKSEGGICFASEIKPLLAVTEDAQVEIVPPGHIMTKNGFSSCLPITPPIPISNNIDQNAKTLHDLLWKSVESQLPSDLECAIKFSGGIDSTLVLHYAKAIDKNVKAYHISRPDGLDRQFALDYASKNDVDLTIVDYSKEDVLHILETIVEATETFEPNIIRNSVFSYLLSKKIHNDGIKVALCGEGADELFCGYSEMRCNPKPKLMRQQFLNDLHKTQLQRVDRCSEQFELETRVPFLDAHIIKMAMHLPQSHLVGSYEGGMMEKVILRKLYELDFKLPDTIRTRSKVVFAEGAGMGDNSMSGPFFDYANLIVSDSEYKDGLRRFEEFKPVSKEEIYYLSLLEKYFPLERLNILKKRLIVNQKSF